MFLKYFHGNKAGKQNYYLLQLGEIKGGGENKGEKQKFHKKFSGFTWKMYTIFIHLANISSFPEKNNIHTYYNKIDIPKVIYLTCGFTDPGKLFDDLLYSQKTGIVKKPSLLYPRKTHLPSSKGFPYLPASKLKDHSGMT